MLLKFLFASIKAGIPLLYGTTGEIVTEKSGSLNLGVEGMMYMGAFMGFFVAYKTDNLILAIIASFLMGMLGALIYAILTITFMANQNVTGLTLTIFGTGLSNFFGNRMVAASDVTPKLSDRMIEVLAEKPLPLLGDIPVLGKLLFSHNILVYFSIFVAVVLGFYMKKTKPGLNMRAVGENPAAADAAGINVTRTKYIHVLLGGGICGIGGAYISMINGMGVWNNDSVNGLGWISVALVIFAAWSPLKAILGSFVFGAFSIIILYAPKEIITIPNAIYKMLPFILTIIVLIFTSMKKSKESSQPASCGVSYFREDR